MDCAICERVPAEVGVQCEDCRDALSSPRQLVLEQVQSTATKPTGAVLVDRWGRPHDLDARTLIGRQVGGFGLSILDGSISRHHAHLAIDPASGTWQLRDIGSANGTMLNEQAITQPTAVTDRDRIAVGQVEFYFLSNAAHLRMVKLDPVSSATLPSGSDAQDAPAPTPDFETEEATDSGLASLEIKLHEPTGGGGGVVVVGEHEAQLGQTQFELLRLLHRRMKDEHAQPEMVRGFVRSSELVGHLPWEVHDPSDNYIKQVVRRTRRALIKAGIGDLIESRHRFGYRLRVVPLGGDQS